MKSLPLLPSCSTENFCFHTGDYSFGFNGKDKESEFGPSYSTFEMRVFNALLGRFFCVDPLSKYLPSETGYQFASNCPIQLADLLGLAPGDKTKTTTICSGVDSQNNTYVQETTDYSYETTNDKGEKVVLHYVYKVTQVINNDGGISRSQVVTTRFKETVHHDGKMGLEIIETFVRDQKPGEFGLLESHVKKIENYILNRDEENTSFSTYNQNHYEKGVKGTIDALGIGVGVLGASVAISQAISQSSKAAIGKLIGEKALSNFLANSAVMVSAYAGNELVGKLINPNEIIFTSTQANNFDCKTAWFHLDDTYRIEKKANSNRSILTKAPKTGEPYITWNGINIGTKGLNMILNELGWDLLRGM